MCGIIGINLYPKKTIDPDVIKTLFLYSQERGEDSTGYFGINTENHSSIVKLATKASEFISTISIPDNFNNFFGHTRKLTVGAATVENAHPFEFENLIGVHNGSLSNFMELQKEEGTNFAVDSQLLYYMIDKYGFKSALPRFEGKLALIWYDKKTKETYLYRFIRPLSIGTKDDGIYYGSLTDYLEGIRCSDIKELQEHTLYTIKDGVLIQQRQLKQKLSPKKTPVVTHTVYHYNNYWENHYNQKNKNNGCDNDCTIDDKYEIENGSRLRRLKTYKKTNKTNAPNNCSHYKFNDGEILAFWIHDYVINKIHVELIGTNEVWTYDFNVDKDREQFKSDFGTSPYSAVMLYYTMHRQSLQAIDERLDLYEKELEDYDDLDEFEDTDGKTYLYAFIGNEATIVTEDEEEESFDITDEVEQRNISALYSERLVKHLIKVHEELTQKK